MFRLSDSVKMACAYILILSAPLFADSTGGTGPKTVAPAETRTSPTPPPTQTQTNTDSTADLDSANQELTQKIRQELANSKTLNIRSRNAGVEIQGNTIILRGQVASEFDRESTETSVRRLAGNKTIRNEILVDGKFKQDE